jgi:hypothetical protein
MSAHGSFLLCDVRKEFPSNFLNFNEEKNLNTTQLILKIKANSTLNLFFSQTLEGKRKNGNGETVPDWENKINAARFVRTTIFLFDEFFFQGDRTAGEEENNINFVALQIFVIRIMIKSK